jgi:hypothetical protein
MFQPFDAGDPLFQANPIPVATLLGRIQNRELALPDFQRSFVWDVSSTLELLASIMSRYPAGTLLFLEMPDGEPVFRPREVEGAPALDNQRPRELVLDGQQRLTALYQALSGNSDQRFFIDLSKMRSEDGSLPEAEQIAWDAALVAKQKKDDGQPNEFDEPAWQIENWQFPLDEYLLANRFDDWLDRLVAAKAEPGDPQTQLKNELRGLRDRYLARLGQYAFPVVTLEEETSLAAVCKIFETLNLRGVRLTVFELLTARFWPHGIDLRALWEAAQDQYDIIGEFGVDPYALLQAVSLRHSNSAQRADVLELQAVAIENYWDEVVRGMAGALDLLKTECGVLTAKWLPYTMILVPMSAVWHIVEGLRGPQRGHAREQLRRYFWCTVFTGNFDQGANSQAGADFNKLTAWLEDDSSVPPEAIADFHVSTAQLLSAKVKRRALYAGIIALAVTHGAKDFHSAQKLTAEAIASQKIDAHHVFPRKWLNDNYEPQHRDAREEAVGHSTELILNRALIDRETNRTIKARAPSDYLSDIRDVRGESALNDILDSHLLPNGEDEGLYDDDYDKFLLSRLELAASQIEAVTGKTVSRDLELFWADGTPVEQPAVA